MWACMSGFLKYLVSGFGSLGFIVESRRKGVAVLWIGHGSLRCPKP